MTFKKYVGKKALLTAAITTSMLASTGAHALSFELDNGVVIDWDTTVAYALAKRIDEPRDPADGRTQRLTDDGTNNFDRGDLINNKVTVVSEADINWGSGGIFLRGKAFYDDVYYNGNASTFSFETRDGDPDLMPGDFLDAVHDEAGADAYMLDYFVYSDFEVADHFVSARLGRQVVSWGESLFFPGLGGAQNRLDAVAGTTPGALVKEVFLPTGQFWTGIELTDKLNMELYYQYEWKPTLLAPVGHYWGPADLQGPGSDLANLGPPFPAATVLSDEEPKDSGQWGVAFRYITDGGTELGLYSIVYHEKNQSAVETTVDLCLTCEGLDQLVGATMQTQYAEDLRMYAGSFSTLVGGWNVVGELSYSPNMAPVQQGRSFTAFDGTVSLDDFQYKRAHFTQANLGFLQVFGENPISDQINVVGEIVYARTNLHVGDNGNTWSNETIGWALNTELSWFGVWDGWDVIVPVNLKGVPKGTFKTNATSAEDAKQAKVGVNFRYLKNLEVGISGSFFWGDSYAVPGTFEYFQNLDRDNVALSVKYAF